MKTLLVLLIGSTWLWFSSKNNEPKKQEVATSLKNDPIDFSRQVQPILKANCSPCHFPGGKLYEKLPFDNGNTIVTHEAGIFRRIKKEEDVKVISQYISQNKTAR